MLYLPIDCNHVIKIKKLGMDKVQANLGYPWFLASSLYSLSALYPGFDHGIPKDTGRSIASISSPILESAAQEA